MPLPGAFGGRDPGSPDLCGHTMPTLDRRLTVASSVAARMTYLDIGCQRQQAGGPRERSSPRWAAHPTAAGPSSPTAMRPWASHVECAIARSDALLGLSNTVMGLVKAGFVVTVSDYKASASTRRRILSRCHDRGLQPDRLGSGRPQADSERLRSLVGIRRFARRPGSVGRQRVGRTVRSDLHIIGSASYSAPLAIDGLADAAVDGTLTEEQRLTLVQVLASLRSGVARLQARRLPKRIRQGTGTPC